MAGRQFSPFLFLFIFCQFLCCPLFSAVLSDDDSGYFEEDVFVPYQKRTRKVRHQHFWEDYEPFDLRGGPKKKPKKRKSKKDCPTSESITVSSIQEMEEVDQALSLQGEEGRALVRPLGPDWRGLPNEVWGIILEHAGFTAAIQLSSTCRDFNIRFGFLREFVNGRGQPDPAFNHHPSLFRSIWKGGGYDAPVLSLRSMFLTARDMDAFTRIAFSSFSEIGSLAAAERVRILDLSHLPGRNLTGVFRVLAHLSGLEELRLDHTPLERHTIIELRTILREQHKIKRFCLQGCGLNDGSLDRLFSLGRVFQPYVLDLSHNQLGGNISKSVQLWFKRYGSSLKELDVSENAVPDGHQLVRVVKNAKRIEVLRLRGICLSAQSGHELFQDIFNTVSPYSRLRELDLRDTGAEIPLKDLFKPLNNPELPRVLYIDEGSLTVGGAFEFLPMSAEMPRMEILKNKENQHKIRIRRSLAEKELNEFVHLRRPSIRHFEVLGELPKSSLAQVFAFTNASTLGLGKWISDDHTMQSIAQYVAQHPHLDTLLLNSALVSPRSAFKLMAFLKDPALERPETRKVMTPKLKKKTSSRQQVVEKEEPSSQRPLTIVFSPQLRPFEALLNGQKPAHIVLNFWPSGGVRSKTVSF